MSKDAFDKTDFVFEVDLEVLIKTLKDRLVELDELTEIMYPTGTEKKRINDLTYWIGIHQLIIPEAKRRGMTTIPCCALESAILELPRKKKTKRK